MPTAPELLRDAISRMGLLDPELSPTQRRSRLLDIAERYDCSEDTVRRQLKGIQAGAPPRKKRSDAGNGRALAGAVVLSLRKMLCEHRYDNATITQLTELLHNLHPEAKIAYSSVRAEAMRFKASLPKAVSTPRRIEIAGANSRWEMDLSVGDLFLADPRLNKGFPFRPQLIVCEDACTRCCMFAAYKTTGRAIDVGAVLHQAILPQSDIWPQCGIPREVGCDWGKVFVGQYFNAACAALGIATNPGHPYYPQDKGKLERFIGTIHHSFENTLVGWCTMNNRGEDSIDPRKFFRQIGAQWIDPRFDRALMTLPQLNDLLHDWIGGSYHRQKHGTLGCSPNDQWLAEMRGRQIAIPDRKFLEVQFLPWHSRVASRGQIVIDEIVYQHEALAQVDGCSVQVRYVPDDVSLVHIYRDGLKVCDASPAPTYIVNQAETMDWATWNKTRRDNHERQALRRQVIAENQAADISMIETEDVIRVNAADADPLLVPGPRELAGRIFAGGYSEQEREELRGVTIWGVPVLADDEIVPKPSPGADDDEFPFPISAFA